MSLYKRHRYPIYIIQLSVLLYHRYALSLRDIEEILAERRIVVSYETIRQWCQKFGPAYAKSLRKSFCGFDDTWYLDEVFVNIQGERHYLWRAVDSDGNEIDLLVQKRRSAKAAKRFFIKLFKKQGFLPRKIVTDKLRSYSAALRQTGFNIQHDTNQYQNNLAEVSHQPTRRQERKMRGFKSPKQAQRFLSIHGTIQNLFNLQRHLLSARNYRMFRDRAFVDWRQATCAPNPA